MTLAQFNLKNGDILTAEKLSITEAVTEVPIVDRAKQCLVPRAVELFSEWYDIYKNQETGLMDRSAVARFISGATKQPCNHDDNRVDGILKTYDTDKDENLTIDDFLTFYYNAASGTLLKAVHSNLKNHNVRLDLKKMSEIVDDVQFSETDMPRHTLSANQD